MSLKSYFFYSVHRHDLKFTNNASFLAYVIETCNLDLSLDRYILHSSQFTSFEEAYVS